MQKVETKRKRLAPLTKPWQLIRDAIADLRTQEKNPLVAIRMSIWHCPGDKGDPCNQCLAGCAMSCRLGARPTDELEPTDYPDATRRKLCAINQFRIGDVQSAYAYLGLRRPHSAFDFDALDYEEDPTAFKRQMIALALRLEKAHGGEPARRVTA
jgi:hypothetical protein